MVIHRIQTDETALSTARWDNPRFAPVDNFSEVSGHFGKRRSVGRNRAGRKTNEERMVLYRRTYAPGAGRWLPTVLPWPGRNSL